MQTTIQWLADRCGENLLGEKWLVAEDLRIAVQWKDRINLTGQATVNLHAKTLSTIAIGLVADQLATEQLNYVNQSTVRMLIRSVLVRHHDAGELDYFGDVTSIDGLSALMSRSIRDMQLAAVECGAVTVEHFEGPRKAGDIRLVYGSYLEILQEHGLVDYPACLRMATAGLKNKTLTLPPGLIVLMPERPPHSPLEEELLHAVAGRARLEHRPELDPFVVAAERLAPLVEEKRQSISYFSALGATNEVRGVFRKVFSATRPPRLDDVEILHPDAKTYPPLILEQMAGWLAELDEDDSQQRDLDRLPVTFADGIACIFSRPGRALRSWLRWARHDFVQARAVQLIREGLLTRDEAGEGIGYSRLASSLREIPIGFQADRYLPKIREAIDAAERALQEYEQVGDAEADDAEADDAGDERPPRTFGLPALRAVAAMVAPLVELAPLPEDDSATVLAKAQRFLRTCARADSKWDRYARRKLLDDIAAMRGNLQYGGGPLDVLAWLEELPIESRIMASGPRPGCVHVSSLGRGGFAGRPRVFVLGMDDGQYPRRVPVDPVLLDAERVNLSPHLTTASQLTERQRSDFDRALYRCLLHDRIEITLSFPTQSLTDDRACYPSGALLELFRITSGNDQAHLEHLLSAIGSPQSFVGTTNDDFLTPSDQEFAILLHEPDVDRRCKWLESRFVHYGHQMESMRALAGQAFTSFDGYVPLAGGDLDVTQADMVSPSRLETYGACPRRFFFRYGLGVRPPDEVAVATEQWLDALQFGNFVHSLFEEFLQQLTSSGLTPVAERDRTLLFDRLSAKIESLQADIPIPNEDAFRRTVRVLEETCETFLQNEEQYCREHDAQPWVLEASIGLNEPPRSEIDCAEPISLSLSDGRLIRVGGRVDRVDRFLRDGSQRYMIWDYKSGSAYGFDQKNPFQQGRKLQGFLYVGMLRHRLAAFGESADAVKSFGYFFPGPKTEGLRLQWTSAELRRGDDLLRKICDLVSAGIFPPTTDASDCKFCDYRFVCGDADEVANASQRKAQWADNERFLEWSELREISGRGRDT